MCVEERSDLRGKPVFDSNGQQIATVERIDQETLYVDPQDDIDSTASLTLGWDRDDGPYRLRAVFIDTITNSGIRLKSNL